MLKQEAIDQLCDTTKQVIQGLGFDLSRDPVPVVMNALEKELVSVGAQLYIPPRRKRMIRHGTSRLEFLPGLEVSSVVARGT